MKKIAYLFVLLCLNASVFAAEPAKRDIVLLVPSQMSLSSDYYPMDMIADDLKIATDSVVAHFQAMITSNLMENSSRFIQPALFGNVSLQNLSRKITFNKISITQQAADIEGISDAEYRQLLETGNGNYLVVINGYFIQHKVKPFPSTFHSISYSVFDNQRNLLTHGCEHFNTFDLQSATELSAANRKAGKRMAQTIVKTAKLQLSDKRLATND